MCLQLQYIPRKVIIYHWKVHLHYLQMFNHWTAIFSLRIFSSKTVQKIVQSLLIAITKIFLFNHPNWNFNIVAFDSLEIAKSKIGMNISQVEICLGDLCFIKFILYNRIKRSVPINFYRIATVFYLLSPRALVACAGANISVSFVKFCPAEFVFPHDFLRNLSTYRRSKNYSGKLIVLPSVTRINFFLV